DPVAGLRRRRLERRLQERNSATARGADSSAQGPHRAVGTRVSALCASRPADRLPARDTALVGLLAEGHRYRRHGRAHAARLDDRKRKACATPRGLAGPVDRRTVLAATGNNILAAVLDGR